MVCICVVLAEEPHPYNKLLPICETLKHAHIFIHNLELSELFTQTLEIGQNHERRFNIINTFLNAWPIEAHSLMNTLTQRYYTLSHDLHNVKRTNYDFHKMLPIAVGIFCFFSFSWVDARAKRMIHHLRMVTLKPQNESTDDVQFNLIAPAAAFDPMRGVPWIIVHFGCITAQEFQVFSLSSLNSLFALERIKLNVWSI